MSTAARRCSPPLADTRRRTQRAQMTARLRAIAAADDGESPSWTLENRGHLIESERHSQSSRIGA